MGIIASLSPPYLKSPWNDIVDFIHFKVLTHNHHGKPDNMQAVKPVFQKIIGKHETHGF